jgi:hypothetical protein
MDQPVLPPDPPATDPILCPNCGQPATIKTDDSGSVIHCPACDADFVATSGEQTDGCAVEWEEPLPTAEGADDELDGLRIRKLVRARRSAIRARTYAVVILICSMFMAVQLILTDVQEVHLYGWDAWAILYTIFAGAMVITATVASRKAAALHRESNLSDMDEPERAPHFDDLSDGSQRVRNLEQIRDDHSPDM